MEHLKHKNVVFRTELIVRLCLLLSLRSLLFFGLLMKLKSIILGLLIYNGDGTLSEDELYKVLVLSTSDNQLELKSQAENYAALIMEELDPYQRGYIELWQIEAIFRELMTSTDHETHVEMRQIIPSKFRKLVSSTKDYSLLDSSSLGSTTPSSRRSMGIIPCAA